MIIPYAKTLEKLPPYLFEEIDRAKRQARESGKDLIDLGIGDPDTPTPPHIIEELYRAAKDPANHRYAMGLGLPELRRTIQNWYEKRFGVTLDVQHEILPLLGSKEGIAHLPYAVLNRGDVALVPDPAYPVYRNATILAGARPYMLPLRRENNFLPDLRAIPARILNKAKLLFLNYPNNPTAAVADEAFYRQAIAFARKYNLVICADMAYSEMTYDGYRSTSVLELEGARDVVIEFHSLSKTYNMTGWRIGWACGNQPIVQALAKIKSNIDSGIFQAVQLAGISALRTGPEFLAAQCALYRERRDVLVDGLQELGWTVDAPVATFYVWARLPKRLKSIPFCGKLLQQAGVVITPGVGFGAAGEGYVRFALTQNSERLRQAVRRLADSGALK